jgi:hypothetical protein
MVAKIGKECFNIDMELKELIKSHLGGFPNVAKDCGISVQAVWQWTRDGFPKSQKNFLSLKYPDAPWDKLIDSDSKSLLTK